MAIYSVWPLVAAYVVLVALVPLAVSYVRTAWKGEK